jgi:hypothetical protein
MNRELAIFILSRLLGVWCFHFELKCHMERALGLVIQSNWGMRSVHFKAAPKEEGIE